MVELAVDARVLEVFDAAALVDQILPRGHLAARLVQPDHVVGRAITHGVRAAQVLFLAGVVGCGELYAGVVAGGEDGAGVVQLEDDESQHQRGGERADQDGDLLP